MRIGIDARFFGPAGKGLGRYTQKLITYLEKIDKQNEYFILLRKNNWDDYQPASRNFQKVLADYRWYTLAEQLGLPPRIARLKLDIMHFTHFNVPWLFRGKFIVTIHDLILTKFPTARATTLGPMWYKIKHAAYQMVIRRAVHKADKIIAVSHFTKQDIINHFGVSGDKIVVTYEAVDPPQKIREGSRDILAKFHIKQPYLLYVGNVYPHKNAEGLLQAFHEVLNDKPNLSLVMVGREDYFFQRIKKEAEVLGLSPRVVFPGFVTDADLPCLYASASVYVFPSFYEGFGLPALEACSYGTPVAASRSSCLPEILGQAAEYFDPQDIHDMARVIRRLLDDQGLTNQLRQRGFRQVGKFSWSAMAARTLDLYVKM
jgi:glycosyltransferase involved in cell wall biosynthesis